MWLVFASVQTPVLVADETLGEGILHRLGGSDVMPVDAALLGPVEDGVRRQLAAVVADDHRRSASPSDDLVEFAAETVGEKGLRLRFLGLVSEPVLVVRYRTFAAARSPS